MRRSWIGIIAVVAVLSAGGVGFAAFTSSVYVNATASAGTLELLFTAPATSIPYVDSFSTSVGACSATLASPSTGPSPFAYSSTTIDFTVSGAAPSDYCLFNNQADGGVAISNLGSLPATVSAAVTCSVNGGAPSTVTPTGPSIFGAPSSYPCGYFLWTDTYTGVYPFTLAAGASDGYAGVLYLPTGTGNGAQGQSVTVAVTITGTAGT